MKNTSRKYKGGNKEEGEKEGQGLFARIFSGSSESGSSESGSSEITNNQSILDRAKKATGFGENDGEGLNKEIDEIKQKLDKDLADAAEKYRKESEANETNKIKLQAELQAANKKIKEDYAKATGEWEKKRDLKKEDAQRTLDKLNAIPGSAPGSEQGGGRRRRSGARNGRSGARRSAARNGNGKSKSKGKKRITRKKGRNNKKRTRRYKKH